MSEPAQPERCTVWVTLFQDPIEVPADEVAVLRAQGLLREAPDGVPERGTSAKSPSNRKDPAS